MKKTTKPFYLRAVWEPIPKKPWRLIIVQDGQAVVGVGDDEGRPMAFDSPKDAFAWWAKNAKRKGWLDEYPGVSAEKPVEEDIGDYIFDAIRATGRVSLQSVRNAGAVLYGMTGDAVDSVLDRLSHGYIERAGDDFVAGPEWSTDEAKYVVAKTKAVKRPLVGVGGEMVNVWVPMPEEGIFDTPKQAKAAFMRKLDPQLVGTSDDFAAKHFDQQARNLKHFKIVKHAESTDEAVKAVRELTAAHTVVHVGPVGRFDLYVATDKVAGLPDEKPVPVKDYLAAPATQNLPGRMFTFDKDGLAKSLKQADDKLTAAGIPRKRATLIVRALDDTNPITGGSTGGWWDRKKHAITVSKSEAFDSDVLANIVAHEWGHAIWEQLPKQAKDIFIRWYRENVVGAIEARPLEMYSVPKKAHEQAIQLASRVFNAEVQKMFGKHPRVLSQEGFDEKSINYKGHNALEVLVSRSDMAWTMIHTTDEYARVVEQEYKNLATDQAASLSNPNRKDIIDKLWASWYTRAHKYAPGQPRDYMQDVRDALQETFRWARFKVSRRNATLLSAKEGASLRAFIERRGLSPSSYGAANALELWAECVKFMVTGEKSVTATLRKLVTGLIHNQSVNW